MDGILLVDKPKGWTSFDVVAKVRGTLRRSEGTGLRAERIKVGHTGTLDPMATGLLVLLIGKATKQAPELSKADKTYEATLKIGFTSTTGDAEGAITKSRYNPRSLKIARGKIEEVLQGLVGEIEQIPPAFSAIKVDGQRAYKLARQGKEVKIEPRKVKVYSISDINHRYPYLHFTTKVSSGTYIRTLAEDIGKKLGTGAYLTNLKRTQVGQLDLKDAIDVDKISADEIYKHLL